MVIMTTCSGHTIRYVKPTPDTPCPADPCLTLSEYAQQPHHYLTSNTTLLLLPGDHALSVNFTVENVSEFEIHASSSSPHAVKIVCQQLVGFTFRNISHMTLHGLTFTSCGKGTTYTGSPTAGVSIYSAQDTEIADCSFQDSIGNALGVFNSSLNFTGSSTFMNNSANNTGGGFFALNSTLNFIGSSTFTNNSATTDGGGFYAQDSTLNFTGSSTFTNNSAVFGGGFTALFSALNFTGSSTFTNNSATTDGGGFFARYSTLNFTDSSTFTNNSADDGGGFFAHDSTLNFSGSSTFMNNSADGGGGFIAQDSTLNFTGSSTFMNNSAGIYGGGFYARRMSTLNFTGSSTFKNNSAGLFGGGFFAVGGSILYFAGNSTTQNTELYTGGCGADNLVFTGNLALIHGGALYTEDSRLRFEGCNIFSGNSAQYFGGGIYSTNSTLKFDGNTNFRSNSGHLQGGGVYAQGTNLYFIGNSSFTANTAAKGGGEYLVHSVNYFSRHANIIFDRNNATEFGGAVYVEDSDPTSYCFPDLTRTCFFQIAGVYHYLIDLQNFQPFLDIHLHFYNNYAQIAGSSVYGGATYSCSTKVCFTLIGCQNLPTPTVNVLHLEMEPNDSISSDPFEVLLCEDGNPIGNTINPELVRQVHPGELLHFPLVASGQGEETIPAVIRAFFNDTHGNTSLAQFQGTQTVKKTCTELYYRVHSSAAYHNKTLVLYADGPCSTDGRLLNVSLQFLPCPPGFSLNLSERVCECEPRLQKYTTRCNITERAVTREGEYWVGYDNSSQALILHSHCPFDFCKLATDQTSFPLNNTDLQCVNSRSGVLCGRCKPGLSLALGSSKCTQCSNVYVLLVIPFALAGIALVLLLLILKLTVADGTINGLIFYSNIVTVNRAIFFPPNQTNILTVFIAWLNLDLGIETCFFDGLDAYAKTWLQFIFPLYIWSLVGLIIIVSDYSSKMARLFGSNPVAVLATLFLLSYAKLLRTIIAALFFTFLDYPNEMQVAVWLYDGNIKYLHGKHIVLFLVASLTLLLLFLPYTLLLAVGQWLQAKSNRRLFHWINKPRIKPFLDAYQAPYKDQHRYWTGLMLFLRSALFLVFAFNTQADPSINLLSIGVVVIGLLTLTHFTGLIYKKMYLDILEISFILNLGILSIATYYVKLAAVPVSQAAVTYTSVSAAFATFVGVLLYHTYQQVWPKLQQKLQKLRRHEERERANDSSSEEDVMGNHEAHCSLAPTLTVIELPDIADRDSDSRPLKDQPPIKTTTFTELREPLDLIDTNDP